MTIDEMSANSTGPLEDLTRCILRLSLDVLIEWAGHTRSNKLVAL